MAKIGGGGNSGIFAFYTQKIVRMNIQLNMILIIVYLLRR